MAGFNFDITGDNKNAGIQKTVFKDTIHTDLIAVPTPGNIEIVESKNINRDLGCVRSFDIKDKNGEVITTIYRSDDEDDPIFYYIPFRGKEYVFTNKTPYHLTIVNVTDREEYSKKLEYNGSSIMPKLMYIYIDAKDEGIFLDIRALCTRVVNGKAKRSNNKISMTIESLDAQLFNFINPVVTDDLTANINPLT